MRGTVTSSWKKNVRAKVDQLGDIERDGLLEYGKKILISEILNKRKRQTLKYKTDK